MAEMTDEQVRDLKLLAGSSSCTSVAPHLLVAACEQIERLREKLVGADEAFADRDRRWPEAMPENEKLEQQNRRYREDRALLEAAAKRFPGMALPTFLHTEDAIRQRFVDEAIEQAVLEEKVD